MDRKSWIAVAGVLGAVVALVVIVKGLRSDAPEPAESMRAAATDGATDVQRHPGSSAQERSGALTNAAAARRAGSAPAGAGAPAQGQDESAAAVVRKRLTSGNGRGTDSALPAGRAARNADGTIDAEARSGDDAAPPLRPQGTPRQNAAQPGAADSEVIGEPAPEVAYDSGPDKRFATDQQVQVPDTGKISGVAGTVSFWVKPQWDAANQDDATFVQLGDSGMHIVKNVNFLRFEYTDGTGAERGLGANISDWNNDWQQVIATWENGHYTLYINGQRTAFNTFSDPPDFQEETKVYVGSYYANGAPAAPGELAVVNVLNRGMSAAEIAKHYQTTKPR